MATGDSTHVGQVCSFPVVVYEFNQNLKDGHADTNIFRELLSSKQKLRSNMIKRRLFIANKLIGNASLLRASDLVVRRGLVCDKNVLQLAVVTREIFCGFSQKILN